jgi:tRNA threonylcarbamoyladenosine biosynthesis protein TsaE
MTSISESGAAAKGRSSGSEEALFPFAARSGGCRTGRMGPLEIESPSEEFTLRLGRALGERLRAGDVVAMTGELGAGKTVLTKGIALGLGVRDADLVVSPTFTLLNEYAGRLTLHHFDLYRLRDSSELRGQDLAETCASGGVTVIEWAERATDALPAERMDVRMEHASISERRIIFSARGARMERTLKELKQNIVSISAKKG